MNFKLNSKKSEIVTAYWLKHYMTDHCTLCGNHGWIDTRGTRTPAGKDVGRVNYCICPNGQQLRAIGAKLPSNTEEHNAEV